MMVEAQILVVVGLLTAGIATILHGFENAISAGWSIAALEWAFGLVLLGTAFRILS